MKHGKAMQEIEHSYIKMKELGHQQICVEIFCHIQQQQNTQ